MLETLKKALKVKEIRKRLLYTFVMLIVVRLGCQIAIPFVNADMVAEVTSPFKEGGFSFLSAITGGSLENMSIFALNITPYITASIIMQLLTIAIPKLDELQKDGEEGRKKITKITRYLSVILALVEAIAMAIGFGRSGYLDKFNVINVLLVVTTLTAGSTILMWIGERITENGVGNGISIVLLINIVSRVPDDFVTLYTQFMKGKTIAKAGLAGVIILAVLLVVVVFVIILQDGERRIAVQYSKKVQGRKMYGGQSTYIPLKVNTAGVIPVIFSSSLMQTPIVIAQFLGKGNGTGIGSKILAGLNSNNWCDPENPIYSVGLVVYILLTIFFAYFYTSITFNPMEIANNMKKSGGFIPGIRPGKPTVDYLTKILNYIIFVGACGLIIVQVIPYFFNGVFGANVSFGGTSLIIIVGVVLETIKKIESQMLVRNYTGFLNNKR